MKQNPPSSSSFIPHPSPFQFEAYQFPSRRSNIIARNGLVATSQPLAAQAGLEALRAGGNAVDAAIATVATLCVVEPTSTGIGGDAFALIWMADEGKLYGLNASGSAPMALTADLVRSQGHTAFPALGALPVTVPGALRGWQLALERFGTMRLDTLLARPIHYARDGFALSQRIARAWGRSKEKMSAHPDSRRVWVPSGQTPRAGEIFRNPEFATTLQTLAERGYDAFYQGDIARQIAQCVQDAGGVLTEGDLANYRAEWVQPISVPYKNGWVFHEIPPNGQGLTALLALNIAQGFDLQALGYGTADYYHALVEAIKLAFADAQMYIADPRQADIPLVGLLSEGYTQQRRGLVDMARAQAPQPGQPQQHGDTVYLTVADEHGNMVSWIQSLYMGFGSGLTAGTTGVQLQNRGANFSLELGHLNEAAPGKRPYHTIIPGFITQNGQAWSSFGVMGGFMQPQGHLQVGLNMVEFGMDPQTALDAPRFNWLKELEVAVETAVPHPITAELARRGHQLHANPASVHYGGGQAIVRDAQTGVLIGGSEPRNDGTAVGW
ncbi:MAG: gamma-glutamyltransferase [Ardenticatenaceae bacterium]|nr:gamma-glutamyltransferase [Ardenticatenaceae bacterium]MCB9004591.1 gamma-glutamyltransferase [Ardenticatenaceae bacterium]